MDALLHISNLLQHAAQDADAAGQQRVANYLRAADMLVWDALHEWVGAPPVEVPTEGSLEAVMLARNPVRS